MDLANSIDTITIVIITAVINAIITAGIAGIIIYRIQKKIDNSYFQQQQMFIDNYKKRVEVLGTLFQKYSEFLYELENKVDWYTKGGLANVESAFEKIDDIRGYFAKNIIYVSPNSSAEIKEVLFKVRYLIVPIRFAFDLDNMEYEGHEADYEFLREIFEEEGIKYGSDENELSRGDFGRGVIILLKYYSDIIERHFRSTSEPG